MLRFLRIFPFLACALATFSAGLAHGQDSPALSKAPVNILDGQQFAGQFVPSGKTSGRADEFVFNKGKFHSRECLAWGFGPGPYWVRTENGRLYFLALLTSKENGVMTYQGWVAGGNIDAAIEWVKPRWYWTMKRKFRFRGTNSANKAAHRK